MCEDDVYVDSLSHLIFTQFIIPFCPAIVLNSVIIQAFICFAVTTNQIMKLTSVFIERERG